MFRLPVLIVFALMFQFSFSQKVLIETGRPKAFVVQNAQEIVGKKYKLQFKYEAFQNDMGQLEQIKSQNKQTNAYLEKKYGKDWKAKFDQKVNEEQKQLEALTAEITQSELIKEQGSEKLIHFEKKCGKGNYIAKVYPAIEPEDRSPNNLLHTIKCKSKRGKTTFIIS